MTRKRAIQILKMNEQEKWRSGITVEEEKESVEMAIEALKKRPHGEWIPCSKRLPDKDGAYIVTLYLEYSKEFIVSLDARFRNHRWDGIRSPVVAWMPLPEPYNRGRRAK